jgi:PBP1b-binding outer membrane lipoprotein LpoB
MKRLLMLAALAIVLSGCRSITHPPQEKKPEPEFRSTVPNGESSPFGP